MLEQMAWLAFGVAMLTGILLFFNVSLKSLKVMVALIAGFVGVPLLLMGGSWYSLLIVLGLSVFVSVPWFLAELVRRITKKLKDKKAQDERTDFFVVMCPDCGVELDAMRECVGRKVQCTQCGAKFVIDGIEEPAPDVHVAENGHSHSGNLNLLFLSGGIPIATSILIAANAAGMIFLYVAAGSIEPEVQAYIECGANFRPLTFGGQWWRMATSAFLHFGLMHFLLNMLCLFSFGRTLEKLIGRVNVVIIYFFAAVLGGLFSCIAHADVVSAGASGAVFGFFGADVSYVLQMRKEYNLSNSETIDYLKSSLSFAAINLIYSLKPGVDMAAHVGGLLAGLALGTIFAIARKEGEGAFRQLKFGLVGIATIIALLLAITTYTGRNAGRMNIDELRREVSALFAEKATDAVKSYGNITVETTSLELVHIDGNKYLGQLEGSLKYGDSMESFASAIDVIYDGENIVYELKNLDALVNCIDRMAKRIVIPKLCKEVESMFCEDLAEAIRKEGAENVEIKTRNVSLIYVGDDSYRGRIDGVANYDCETEDFSFCIKVTFDGETIAYEMTEDE